MFHKKKKIKDNYEKELLEKGGKLPHQMHEIGSHNTNKTLKGMKMRCVFCVKKR